MTGVQTCALPIYIDESIYQTKEGIESSNKYIFEATAENFDQVVLQNSNKLPVVTLFMAVWSEPCFVLSEIFSKLAKEFAVQFIFTKVDRRVWQIIDFIGLMIIVPAVIYFVQNSLRKASETLIDKNETLHIKVRNLVKIYDWDSRFMREWKSGINIRKRLGIEHEYKSIKDFEELIWQIPLIGFIVYFIYFHLESGLWYFILPIFLYILSVYITAPLVKYANNLKNENKHKLVRLSVLLLTNLIFWVYPAFALFLFFKKYELLGLIIPMGSVWYLLILIKVTSDNLYKKKVDVNRIKGRFKGIRKGFYRFVLAIPVIGKKKIPFKALKGVSVDIENGMFGLLGPNGAGKSTLMRTIASLQAPSSGSISFNDIDVVRLSGGEVLLNDDLIDYVDYFYDRGINVILQTNGSIEIPADIYSKLHKIYLSLYSDEETHNLITKNDH